MARMASMGRMKVKVRQYFAVRRIATLLIKLLLLALMAFIIATILSSDAPNITIHDVHKAVGRLRGGDYFDRHKGYINPEKIDWHDYEFMMKEAERHGIGEANDPAPPVLSEDELKKDELFLANGYNARLSDQISVNRSVPDIRHKDCHKKEYLKDLPTASVIIPFFDDHLSTLVRTVHSVINRSPPQLLKEVILVNDHSTKPFLYEELDEYVKKNFKNVKVVVMPERSGLIVARSEGARHATGDVLIFLDSHCEATTNWLPPLLEPIALNYRVCMCPYIDVISYSNYRYVAQDEGQRGIFNWKFLYKRVPVRPQDRKSASENFPSPVMAGGLFAISSKFFWELGGYDEGLDIWGGEQYELSFKIWQCHGAMYDTPCSRVGHVYRGYSPFPNARPGKDFISINYRRVAEVWMDEYAEYLYERQPACREVDPGDLTKQKAVREKWQCKSFKWFLEEVAPDLLENYPPVEPPPFAKGAISSMASPHLCIDTLQRERGQIVGLFSCHSNRVKPDYSQMWVLSHEREIRNDEVEACLDVYMKGKEGDITMRECHLQQGNQLFRYDLKTKQIMNGRTEGLCLEAFPDNMEVKALKCDPEKLEQRWKWGFTNDTALNHWEEYGKNCLKKKYLKDLPTASVIIPFHNEHFSVLLRTVHGVLNRSPAELIEEVILVNDHSPKEFFYNQLQEYIDTHFKNVKMIVLPERVGLIQARIVGAKVAIGDVLIFLDSHCEPTTNWLPPLLEPIALNYRVCTCPFIDVITSNNLQYKPQDEGARGIFDWRFKYGRIKIRPGDREGPSDNFPSPVMAGGLFAISTKFFWELGGYDEKLDIWGGEQFELSFKIWQCHGAMYDSPCSRVGHIYRGYTKPSPHPRNRTDFLSVNFKRVAAVWMDEYAEYLYQRKPQLRDTDPGDLTKQLAVREKLQCKSFKWFMEEVAPDILEKYPPVEPPPFAMGAIKSLAYPSYCVDTMQQKSDKPLGLYYCAADLLKPQGSQNWKLSFDRDIRMIEEDKCFDAAREQVILFSCHLMQGNQLFRYDLETKQIKVGKREINCVEAVIEVKELFVKPCNAGKLEQKWQFAYTNETMLNNWLDFGKALLYCHKKEYLKDLPIISVVIPFFDDHLSTLVRTVHSVINRTPPQLLKEVIMVNDHSTKSFLYKELRQYINDNFQKVQLIELSERSGLIRARLAGAKAASGDVLVFLDSHCEVNYNWLPPLLEPIALNYQVCTVPFIDVITWNNFKYQSQDEGARGICDWKFNYKRVKLRPGDQQTPTDNFPSPVMAGGLFAISSKFFWELGGYDEGLDIWGGEQYELSFKIWQCGGAMYDCPCSRIGHVYRGPGRKTEPARPPGVDYKAVNFKRVATVWMDEFAEAVYERMNNVKLADPGDLTKQLAVRQRLQCKPFKWFLEEIAPDMLQKYPIKDPEAFAKGVVTSIGNPNYCLDSMGNGKGKSPGVFWCNKGRHQQWILSYARDIRMEYMEMCIDVSMSGDRVMPVFFNCHENQGNQLFRYDLVTKQIIQKQKCLEASVVTKEVFMVACDFAKLEQKWNWEFINVTMLTDWTNYGFKLL